MPFAVVWDDQDPSIVRLGITGPSTWDEAHSAYEKAVEFVKAKSQRVDVIFHEMNAKAMPPGNPIPHFKIGFEKLMGPPNAGIICVVSQQGVPKLAQPFMYLMLRLYRFDQSRIGGNFRSLEEARRYIARDRAKARPPTATKAMP